MSKKSKKINIEKKVLDKIRSEEIKMKPKWYFFLGSFLLFLGLTGVSIFVVFLINILFYLFRRNSKVFFNWRLEQMFLNFPWWILIFAIIGIGIAIWLLKKYDFSYKNNFKTIIVVFIISLFLGGLILNYLGVNETLQRGRMRRFYQSLESDSQEIYRKDTRERGWKEYDRIRRRH